MVTVLDVLRAARRVEVLPVPFANGEAPLRELERSASSQLDVVASTTGGVLVDAAWLRLLGAGCSRLPESLRSWNGLREADALAWDSSGVFILAHDAVGGFFALRDRGIDGGRLTIHYLAPDTLEWQDLGMGYNGFVEWAAIGDLDRFYSNVRWSGWREDVLKLPPDHGFSFYPPLWAEAPSLDGRSRRPVPMRELWGLANDIGAQLRRLPNGTRVRIVITDDNAS